MKGTLTDEERDRLIAKANEKAEHDRGHAWWIERTRPQRKITLRRELRKILDRARQELSMPEPDLWP